MDNEITDNALLEQMLVRPVPPPVEAEKDDSESLDDLFEGPQPEDNDIEVDDLLELDDSDLDSDLEDVLGVNRGDVINGESKPKPKPRFRRTGKVYTPPQLGSIMGL